MDKILKGYSNKSSKKWPAEEKNSYQDVLNKVFLLYENFDYQRQNYKDHASEALIKLSIVSAIRDRNLEVAKKVFSGLDIDKEILGQSIVVFHCIKNQIDFEDLFGQCNLKLKSYVPKDSKVFSYMALNSFLVGDFSAYSTYKIKALERLEEHDESENKWAYLNMLIFSGAREEIPVLSKQWDSVLSRTFYVPNVWNNIIMYEPIETLFWFKELFFSSGDRKVYKYFVKKIGYSKLFDNLNDYVVQFNSRYGLRIVFPILLQTNPSCEQFEYWLNKEHVESLDFTLLLYALKFPQKCKEFVVKNISKLFDFSNNSVSSEFQFNLGKISALINYRIDEYTTSNLEKEIDYLAGLAYYDDNTLERQQFFNQALDSYDQKDNEYEIQKLCYIVETSYKTAYGQHNALVNYVIEECIKQKENKVYYLGKLLNSLSKTGDFTSAYKVFRKIPKSTRFSHSEKYFWTLCLDKNYSGISSLIEQIDAQDYNDIQNYAYRSVMSLNNFGNDCFNYSPELDYRLI